MRKHETVEDRVKRIFGEIAGDLANALGNEDDDEPKIHKDDLLDHLSGHWDKWSAFEADRMAIVEAIDTELHPDENGYVYL